MSLGRGAGKPFLIVSDVHLGAVAIDGRDPRDADAGPGVSRTIAPPAGATGERVTVVVHLADGLVSVDRR